MGAHSRESLRRSSRRGDQAPNAGPVTETQIPSIVTLSHRTKRNRLSSISDAENLRKKRKIEHFEYPSEYKFPLRSRPNNEPLRALPLKSGNKPVSSVQKEEISAARIPKQKTIGQIAEVKLQRQPSPIKFNDKRTLRSRDGGSRSKSELSLYFTNYEQMLSLKSAKPGEHTGDHNIPSLTNADLLTARTHVTLIDDLSLPSENHSLPSISTHVSTPGDLDPFGATKPLHNAHRVDLTHVIPGHSPRRPIKDTLPEDIFYKAHRKAERHEKQLRNIERERAQHEKVQLDRLLEELRGPDWLKVMGISGVTESEKKLYEPKRVFFIREVAGLIEKFRHWREEEKRRKIEREQALLAEEEDGEDQDDEEEKTVSNSTQHRYYPAPAPISPISPAPPPPDTNDVDAAAARQLHQEAQAEAEVISPFSRSSTYPRKKPSSTNTSPSLNTPPHLKQDPHSFFAKRHMRDAAVAGHRRGRNKLAFGEPVPEPEEEREFKVPSNILTWDMIRARARLRRRLRRGSVE